MKLRFACVAVGFLSLLLSIAAQTPGAPASTAASAQVPPLIQFSNIATDEGGNTLSGAVSITFSLYAAQQGGEPLWTETQNNVQLDATGHYSVQLGITQPTGVPKALFTTGEARWLGVRIAEQVEQPRVLLLSVPYALKAGDAATLGGLPASAFVLAAPSSGSSVAAPLDASVTPQSSTPPPAGSAVTGTGTVNYLPLWDTTSDILSSVLFQSGTGSTAKIGINTTTPASTLDVKGGSTIRGTLSLPAAGNATATKGANSQPLNLAASAFSSTTSKAVAQTFQWLAEPVGNDTATASGTLNLLFGAGATKPAETGFNIASNGQITFAPGQTFPGTGDGTITGIITASGSGLTGGATSGNVTLGLTTCATGQILQYGSSGWSCSSAGTGTVTGITAGTGISVTGSAPSPTVGINTSVVPQLGAANVFTGNQTVNGNLSATGIVTGSSFEIGSNLFDYGSYTSRNAFLGFAGPGSATTGGNNTGTGWGALAVNTGSGNTANGYAALNANTAGGDNTAVGYEALYENQTGNQNTALGAYTLLGQAGSSSSNNTAIGYAALSKNTGGGQNTAVGDSALYSNSGSTNNTAVGYFSLYANTTGIDNTAIGSYALQSNTSTGIANTATGYFALDENSTGTYNTANGWQAMEGNTTGTSNTGVGGNSLFYNTTGNYNAALGYEAGYVADVDLTGTYNTFLGSSSGYYGLTNPAAINYATAIGANAQVTQSNSIVLGAISGQNGCTSPCGSTSVGIGTTKPAYPLDVSGTIRSSAGGFMFPDGTTQTTAAKGGGGTVTSVASGAGLTGGPITTSGTLSIATGGVSNTMLANPSLTVTAGTGLTGGGAVTLGGSTTLNVDTTKVPQLSAANTFTGNQTINANILLPNTTSGGTQGVIDFGGVPFIHNYGPSGSYNAFFGRLAGSVTNSGYFLTAVGDYALDANTSGQDNTALGYNSGAVNTTGSLNTFLGYNANPGSSGLTNASAIGANAVVSESNALVLGPTGVSVGIGTATPAYTLDVHGTGNFTGTVNFASGQTFPGVPSLGAANTFTAPQTINASSGNGLTINATTGAGLSANASSANGTGIFGFGGYLGVWGDISSTAAGAAGVVGQANGNGQTEGVYGLNYTTTNGAAGVAGNAAGTSGDTYGVLGENASPNGIGVYGVGVGPSVTGATYTRFFGGAYGVWGDTNQTGGILGVGVVGTADDSIAGEFENYSDTYGTLYVANFGSGGIGDVVKHNALLLSAYGGNTGKGCAMDVSGTLNCEGTVTAVVPTNSGARKVSLYAVQSPENWFEDAGSGQLSKGSARIELDPTFAQTVNTGTEYHVFLTPNGDCKGLYVSQKTANSFEVHELGGGSSSIAFDYRIMAKRSGYENVRLTDVTEQYKKMAEQRELRRGRPGQRPVRPSVVPPAIPKMPTPPVLPVRAAVQSMPAQPTPAQPK